MLLQRSHITSVPVFLIVTALVCNSAASQNASNCAGGIAAEAFAFLPPVALVSPPVAQPGSFAAMLWGVDVVAWAVAPCRAGNFSSSALAGLPPLDCGRGFLVPIIADGGGNATHCGPLFTTVVATSAWTEHGMATVDQWLSNTQGNAALLRVSCPASNPAIGRSLPLLAFVAGELWPNQTWVLEVASPVVCSWWPAAPPARLAMQPVTIATMVCTAGLAILFASLGLRWYRWHKELADPSAQPLQPRAGSSLSWPTANTA